MKKLLSIFTIIAMAFTFSGCSKKSALETIKERGYIVIGTEGNWSPWTYHDENNNLTGFDVEVGKLIAEHLGVEARFEEAAWESLLAGVDSGRFDIICNGVGYTEERAKSYEFSDPYVYTRKVLIVSADNDDIKSFEDLKGKKTANSSGSTYAELAKEYGAEVDYIDTFEQTITLLLQGRIDATINAELSYVDYMTQHPDEAIKIVASSEGESVCYPVKKGETELAEAVNEALEELRANGKLAELSVQFFNKDITNK